MKLARIWGIQQSTSIWVHHDEKEFGTWLESRRLSNQALVLATFESLERIMIRRICGWIVNILLSSLNELIKVMATRGFRLPSAMSKSSIFLSQELRSLSSRSVLSFECSTDRPVWTVSAVGAPVAVFVVVFVAVFVAALVSDSVTICFPTAVMTEGWSVGVLTAVSAMDEGVLSK